MNAEVPTVGVAGFGRCGSSMMMRLLHLGGVRSLPRASTGSHEVPLEDLRAMPPVALRGRAVKVLDSVLYDDVGMPHANDVDWLIIWMRRNTVEQGRSQVKFYNAFVAPQVPGPQLAENDLWRWAKSYRRDEPIALRKLRRIGPVLTVAYEQAIASPLSTAAAVNRFLQPRFPRFDPLLAASAVHQRDPACAPDLAFERGERR